MQSGRLFFRIVEAEDGGWVCRRGRTVLDRHTWIEEALGHLTQIAVEHRPSQVLVQRADVGQGEQSWVVLADPEGNEFCVLGSRVS